MIDYIKAKINLNRIYSYIKKEQSDNIKIKIKDVNKNLMPYVNYVCRNYIDDSHIIKEGDFLYLKFERTKDNLFWFKSISLSTFNNAKLFEENNNKLLKSTLNNNKYCDKIVSGEELSSLFNDSSSQPYTGKIICVDFSTKKIID
jgi:hypothetical protein